MITLLLPLLLLLAVGAFGWAFAPRGTWQAMLAQWRRLPRRDGLVLVLFVTASTWYGADKGYVARTSRVAQLLTVMSSGELRGPTNTVASAIAGAAVQGVLDESAQTLVTISNAIEWMRVEIPLLEDAITNTSIAWLQSEIPAPLTTGNPVARADMLQIAEGDAGLKHVLVSFSIVPASAPSIDFWVDDTLCVNVSNSFPATVTLATPSGAVPCYTYTVEIPSTKVGTVLLPEREITFGGGPAGSPLAVLGSLMVNDQFGFTGDRLIAPGVVGTFEGGALVEVRDE